MGAENLSQSDQLAAQILAALTAAVDRGEISCTIPASVRLERPKNREHGDFATSIALQLAKSSGKSPLEVAQMLQRDLQTLAEVAKVDICLLYTSPSPRDS